jgi:membrane protein implicated in regulation of membrane protease activity
MTIMESAIVWWILAGAAVVTELSVGTLYLLMFAIGLAAAALGAHAGLGVTAQIALATVVGGGATVGWHFLKTRQATPAQANANSDVNPDIGSMVQVEAWNSDGTASVKYRGAQWAAIAAAGSECTSGNYRIQEVHGNRLTIVKI